MTGNQHTGKLGEKMKINRVAEVFFSPTGGIQKYVCRIARSIRFLPFKMIVAELDKNF